MTDPLRALACYPRLASNFDVTIHNDTVTGIDQLAARFADAEALILLRERTPIPAQLIDRLPNLKFISQTGGGASHVALVACTARGIPVAAAGAASASAAELTWALVMASMRKVHLEAARLKAGQWQGHLGLRLEGKTLGIAGYGKIGKRVARYGKAFGMNVVVWGRSARSTEAARGWTGG
jgi:D-3-phosphoglycerate dehydrogenase